ncbi:hypothetical protein ACFB49_47640 [Sphingomonas sp. DBB INV C78]
MLAEGKDREAARFLARRPFLDRGRNGAVERAVGEVRKRRHHRFQRHQAGEIRERHGERKPLPFAPERAADITGFIMDRAQHQRAGYIAFGDPCDDLGPLFGGAAQEGRMGKRTVNCFGWCDFHASLNSRHGDTIKMGATPG